MCGRDGPTLLSNRSAALLSVGRAEAALEDAYHALTLRPSWGKAHGRHGAALAALRCTAEAVAAYERGVRLTPDSTTMRTELSQLRAVLADEKQATEAAAKVEEVEAQEAPAEAEAAETDKAAAGGGGDGAPKQAARPQQVVLGKRADGSGGMPYVRVADMDELREQGTEAFKQGEYEEAEKKWSAALRRRPDDATLLSNRSAAWLALGEKQLALGDATRCVELHPDWYKGHGRLGAALSSLSRPEEALAAYARGLEIQPSSAVLQAEIKRLRAQVAANGDGGIALTGLALAKECTKLGRPEQAVRELDKLITNQVTDAELYCERSLAHASCHRLALAHEDASTAVYLYGLQHDPEIQPWENLKELGITLMTRQEKNALAKKEGRAFLLRGQAETRLCDYDAAMRTYQLGCKADARLGSEALKELREAWYAAKELCRGWRRAGRLKNAEKKRQAFVAERRPVLHDIEQFARPGDRALALRNLASLHTRWEMHADAVELLTSALAHTPDDQYLTYQRAKAHRAMGNHELALPDARLVVSERPGWIEGLIFLGNVEGQLRHWGAAAAHWHEALVLQPHNPNLRCDLERALVEMSEEEAARHRELVARRQTGDTSDAVALDGGAVELEAYEEDGREFFRPKGTGERLEKEQANRYAAAAARLAARAAPLVAPAAPAPTPALALAQGSGEAVEVEEAAQPEFLRSYLGDRGAEDAGRARVVGERAAAKRLPKAPADDWGRYMPTPSSSSRGGGAQPSSAVAAGSDHGGAPLLGRSVVIDKLLARPTLNGSRGVATSFNAETGRYNVTLPKGEVVALKPSNLSAATEAVPSVGASRGGAVAKDAAAAAKYAEVAALKKRSIGARMAAKRNAKGIAWASKSADASGVAGMFASNEKRDEVAARRAANAISEDYDEVAEAEAARLASLTVAERELERKATALKELATKHLGGMDVGRAIRYLSDAIEMRPGMKELWSNRSHAYEMYHEHQKALEDGEEAVRVAPDWPKGYLRTARALMSLERGAEAAARLRTALDLAPRDEILLCAYKEAMVLAECTRRTETAIRASSLPTFNGVGDSDIVDIARGRCIVKGCVCNAYIQKHGRTTVLLQGRGHVRQDNDPNFFLCARCGHDCVHHVDLRKLSRGRTQKPGKPGGALPSAPTSYPSSNPAIDRVMDTVTSYTNAAKGTRGGLQSNYYYAAASSFGAEGSKEASGCGGGGGGSGSGHSNKSEWEDELDPSLYPYNDCCDQDPLR